MSDRHKKSNVSGWWFGTFFIFPYIGHNHPKWLIFFRGVQTTNQVSSGSKNSRCLYTNTPQSTPLNTGRIRSSYLVNHSLVVSNHGYVLSASIYRWHKLLVGDVMLPRISMMSPFSLGNVFDQKRRPQHWLEGALSPDPTRCFEIYYMRNEIHSNIICDRIVSPCT